MTTKSDVAVQYKHLRRTPEAVNYALYKAALEYDLIEPIIIEGRQDLRSERKWRDHIEPFQHQVSNLMHFCRRLPVTMLADDVGLGKTISAGLIASELISRHKISKMFIVCPKLLMPQWKEELESKFSIPCVIAAGAEVVKARPPKPEGAVITTYHSARLHLDAIEKTGFDMLILDEAHKLRNLYGTEKAPAVAKRFRKTLADRTFKYVVMLTATPIQNRLWDLYSLIDLLTVARGHENPFGSIITFGKRFIADKADQARRLRPERRDEFRSIVYGYMSRVRREDAKLYFPERKVQMSRVSPTTEELELFKLIAEPIQKMNHLSQISIAQALVSSPQALVSQLENMAANKTAPPELFEKSKSILARIKTTAKLQGLAALIEGLRKERPVDWRAVVFTSRRETQAAVAEYLESLSISYGVINGNSGPRNQETIKRFRSKPPEIHVIISTEAGSEGVNLQAANVVVNYDLPWNPMIVEQRIGRVQRLASDHANVIVFNVVLAKTFEEYIVGRLMEKLQMASHAIGDVESLLEASGMDDEGPKGFQEKLRELVMTSIAGKDTEKATRLTEASITEAKEVLKKEEENINSIFGSMGDASKTGPRAPKLPPLSRTMTPRDFVLAGLSSLGANVQLTVEGSYYCDLNGSKEKICFDDGSDGALYAPGSPAFERLVSQLTSTGLHYLSDGDHDVLSTTQNITNAWATNFNGKLVNHRIAESWRSLSGSVLLRARATVAHDSYERLIEVACSPQDSFVPSQEAISPLTENIDGPGDVGVSQNHFVEKALLDPSLSEFCRFYHDRLAEEKQLVGEDDRKRKKLEDDLTPRIAMTVVGMQGTVRREVKVKATYSVGSDDLYESIIQLIPSANNISAQPSNGTCSLTGVVVPIDCLATCVITCKSGLRHLLVRSEKSNRLALPEYAVTCAVSGKRLLKDEVEASAISGKPVAIDLLKTSPVSGKKAEAGYFQNCEFTSTDVLKDELVLSQISGKQFRADQKATSAVSGKMGHQSELIQCAETNQYLCPSEAERCQLTGRTVMPGILQVCEETGRKVLPSELGKCAITGKKVLNSLLVTSSVSETKILRTKAIESSEGLFCAPNESAECIWGGRRIHPSDMRTCSLSGVPIHFSHLQKGDACLTALANSLDGKEKKSDADRLWNDVASAVSQSLDKARCQVESAELSPDGQHLAACLEVRTWMRLKTRHAGVIYSIPDRAVVGRVVLGKREQGRWRSEKN